MTWAKPPESILSRDWDVAGWECPRCLDLRERFVHPRKMKIVHRAAAFLFRHKIRGATRFYAVTCKGQRIDVRSKHGIRLSLDPHEYVDNYVLRFGYYEEEILDALTRSLNSGEVFWDIGSNLGLHALTVARLRPDSRVYAFEPNPMMADLISAAVTQNKISVDVIKLALDSENRTAKFYMHKGNAGRSGLHNWESDPTLDQIDVSTATGDFVIDESTASVPNVIKIDVEGNEERVLRGMPRLLRDPRLHTVVFEDSTDDCSEPKKILREMGFTIGLLNRRESTHHNLENYVAKRPALVAGR